MAPTIEQLAADKAQTALLVIDMQNDFLLPGAPVPADGGLAVVPMIKMLADATRDAGLPVVYTREVHRSDDSDFGIELIFEPRHCLEDTEGAEILDDLKPEARDMIISNKRRYDAFVGTDLDTLLRIQGVTNLIVTGVCTDICVISTVQHARNLDYRCFVATDATAGSTRERHSAALTCMEHVFAYVGPANEMVRSFGLTLKE